MSKDNKNDIVGKITQKVIDTFGENFQVGQPIFCGESNKAHMKSEHPADFEIYGDKIEEIIQSPDFLARHPKNGSIQYVKIYKNENDDHVLVAVRASGSGVLYAKTLFVMDPGKIDRYAKKNALKPYK